MSDTWSWTEKMKFPNKNYANRGMAFEQLITMANQVYRQKGIAAVIKIPTSWKVLWKNYGGYRKPINAFPESKAFLDYVGAIDGDAVTFDTKETNNKTSFPLSNVKEHQMRDMRNWCKCGGFAFLLVWWKERNEVYLLPYEVLLKAWNEAKKGGRKSISYKQFQTDAIEVHSGNGVYFDYLTAYKTYRGV